jgi:hypothetical protein
MEPAAVPGLAPFSSRTAREAGSLRKGALGVLQVNVGKLCNQACTHCHVDAGPARQEIMTRETAEACLRFLADSDVPLLDITGGAPELCPEFERLALPEFFRRHAVELVCSLPCYSRENVEKQRGKGVFGKSIQALQRLNAIGYGQPGSGLLLDLAYNPVGATLPPPQAALEAEFKQALAEDFGIVFNRLLTITNMPISRFTQALRRQGSYDAYLHLLSEHFNAATLDGLMCQTFLSVGWDGLLYDCDFNQMLDMPLRDRRGRLRSIQDAKPADFPGLFILTGNHCYGCTAGAGSSCGGVLSAPQAR